MAECVGHIKLPLYALPDNHFTGLRQTMLDAGPHSVSTGGGLGSDSIWTELETDGKTVYRQISGRDLLAAVAQLTQHPDAGRFPTTTDYEDQT